MFEDRALDAAKEATLAPLASASLVGYQQASLIVAKAHALSVVSDAFEGKAFERKGPAHLLAELNDRVDAMAPSLRAREPVLATRMTTLLLLGRPEDAAAVCVQLAKNARKFGNYRAAAAAANKAQVCAHHSQQRVTFLGRCVLYSAGHATDAE